MRIWRSLGFVCCLACLALAAVGRAVAQSDCMKGNVFGPLHVNAPVVVCGELSVKVPELQKQLDGMQKELRGNHQLMLELTRSARSVNAVGREMDASRQVELLRSFSKQLRESVSADQKQTQQQIAELANKLDALQELLTEKNEDEKTAQQTQAALNGPLGDSIAALDFIRAQAQLDSIQAKLEVIGGDVKVTRDNTQVIRETLEAREAREKATADAEARKAKEIDEDPNTYTRAQIMPLGITPLHYMVFFYTRPPLYPPFIDSTFSMAFRKGTSAWRVDATDKQVGGEGELWKINFDEVGDKATICFVANDRPSGRLKEWMQRYKLTPSATRAGDVNFIPDGDAIMRLTDGGPCDGVTQVRQEAAAVAPAPIAPPPSVANQYKDQMAQIQQSLADMRAQARKTGPQAYTFATIRAEGSRRDHANGDNWQIKVDMQPWPRAQLFDVHVQANLIDASGKVTPLQLSNRQLFVNIESRYATVGQMGTKAVICVTAKDPQYDKIYRLTQWFSIEASRVYWNDGGRQVPGDQATFVPAQPATIAQATDAPCN